MRRFDELGHVELLFRPEVFAEVALALRLVGFQARSPASADGPLAVRVRALPSGARHEDAGVRGVGDPVPAGDGQPLPEGVAAALLSSRAARRLSR